MSLHLIERVRLALEELVEALLLGSRQVLGRLARRYAAPLRRRHQHGEPASSSGVPDQLVVNGTAVPVSSIQS